MVGSPSGKDCDDWSYGGDKLLEGVTFMVVSVEPTRYGSMRFVSPKSGRAIVSKNSIRIPASISSGLSVPYDRFS